MARGVRFTVAALLASSGQAAAQTQVSNTALLTYPTPRGPATLTSNTVTFAIDASPAPVPVTMLLGITASAREAAAGEPVVYRLTLANRDTKPARPHVRMSLPQGQRYVSGSVRGADLIGDGAVLDLLLPEIAAGATVEFRYTAIFAAGVPTGEAVTQAVATIGGGVASNEAMAAVRIRAPLFTDAMTILGRVETAPCGAPEAARRGVPGVRLLLENGMFVTSDRDGMFHVEGIRPGRHVVQIDPASLGGRYAPMLCSDDTRAAGSSSSRFVEGLGGAVQRVDFRLREIAPPALPSTAPKASDDAVAAGDRDWLHQAAPGTAILFPGTGYNPRAPVTRVVVAHMPGQRVALRINDAPVDPLSFDGTEADASRGVAVSRWTGIPLAPGTNRIVARVLSADGVLAKELTQTVTVSGTAARATFDAKYSTLVADGRTKPLIAVRVVDGAGRPVRDGTLLRFAVDAPYAAASDAALDQRRAAAGQARDTTARVTGDEGVALIALEPTTQAGAVHLSVAPPADRAASPIDIRAWLEAGVQDWVVVGFANGTVGHDMLTRHREGGPPVDGRLALYAKGRIKGSWLLTIAYDSDRLRDRGAVSRGSIDPNRYYTVYGDASRQGQDASGGGDLYLRLERRDAYVLFGDVQTGFGDTQLMRYLRSVDGVKAAYEGKTVRASGFVARPSSSHVRDEIRGAGITGPYRLTTHAIVPDSDTVAIEIRDRVRSEVIVSRRTLTRHIDYEIDPALGALRFREPVLAHDLNQNAVFVIAEYETDGSGGGKAIAGGRVSVVRGRIELGGSVLHDEGFGNATVVGGDVKVRIDAATVLRAEVASGGRGGLGAGKAYIAEVEHHDAALDVSAYVRQQDAGFGVGQQNAVEAGTRKIGLDARAVLAPRTVLTTSAWTQTLLDGTATRSSGEVRAERVRDWGSLYLGAQVALEQVAGQPDRVSRLLKLGGSRALAGGALILSGETQIGASDGSAAFPVRQRIAASYRLIPAVRIVGAYELTATGPNHVGTAQAGLDLTPWSGATLSGMLNRSAGSEDGARMFAVYGVDQSVTLGPRWTLNATLDSTATLDGPPATTAKPDPFGAAGGEDATAATIGATYRAARWSATGRLEYRDAAATTRYGLSAGVLRALGDGRTLGANVRGYRTVAADGTVADYATGDLALALRPPTSRWSLLDRLELRYQRGDVVADAPASIDGATRQAVNNLAIDYQTAPDGGGGFEASLYYGAKYSDGVAASFIDVTGIALRHDLATWLDVGVQATVQHGWTTGTLVYSGGPTLGVSPAKGVWISGGYNVSGFHDGDFTVSNYTRGGPFLTLRTKFDQNSLGLTK